MLKHQFVAKQVLNRIDEKIYAEKLPSIRALMDEFQVSQATVTQALRQLIELNKVYVQENVGYFIIPKKQIPDEREEIFDFSTTSTSWTDFPLDSYAQCLEIALKNEKNELFTYGAVDGNHELKKSFQKLLEEEQIFARTDQIVITSGSQQALHILALMLKGTDSILIEQPTYHLMVKLIERLNLSYITCHRETNKVDLATLQKTIERDHPKYVYLMPRLHNPLGTTMTEHEKKVILDYAKKYDFYIIEDDYLSDFESASKYKTMFEMDTNHRVIYLKSFSKIMFPGQRLGLTVLPQELTTEFVELKEVIDIQTNTLSQVIMQTFIESGLYEHHKDKIVLRHRKKADTLRNALKIHFEHYIFNDNHQMHTVIELPKEMNMNKLYQELAKRNVLVDDHNKNYVSTYKRNHKFLKLNTTSISENRIEQGICLILEAIEASKIF